MLYATCNHHMAWYERDGNIALSRRCMGKNQRQATIFNSSVWRGCTPRRHGGGRKGGGEEGRRRWRKRRATTWRPLPNLRVPPANPPCCEQARRGRKVTWRAPLPVGAYKTARSISLPSFAATLLRSMPCKYDLRVVYAAFCSSLPYCSSCHLVKKKTQPLIARHIPAWQRA